MPYDEEGQWEYDLYDLEGNAYPPNDYHYDGVGLEEGDYEPYDYAYDSWYASLSWIERIRHWYACKFGYRIYAIKRFLYHPLRRHDDIPF